MNKPNRNPGQNPSPKRGEIYWVNLDPTVGSEIRKTRPCVVISLAVINERRRTIVVVPLSSAGTPRPPLVIAIPSAGPGRTARIDQIRSVDKARLAKPHGMLDHADLNTVEHALRTVLGL